MKRQSPLSSRNRDPDGHEHQPDSIPVSETSIIYRVLLDTLDHEERHSVLRAIKRHDYHVRAAETAGVRPTEAP